MAMDHEHYSEELIEAMASAGTPPDDHLRQCPRCAGRYDFLLRFHEHLRIAVQEPAIKKIADMASNGPAPPIIQLRPHGWRPSPSNLGISETTIVLAAQSAIGADVERFMEEETFISEEHGVVVRVLIDRQSNRNILYLLIPEDSMRKHALISLSLDDGSTHALVTDAAGTTSIPKVSSESWHSALLALHLPVARFTNVNEGGPTLESGGVSLALADEGDLIRCRITTASAVHIRHAILLLRDHTTVLRGVDEGMLLIPQGVRGSIAEISLLA